MSLSKWQRAARTGRVGASEVPALLGMSPYMTPADVFDRVTGQAPDREPNINMRVGTYLEGHVLKMARWLGLNATRCNRAYVHPWLPLSASPDAYTAPHRGYGKGLGEVKVTSAWASGIDRAPEYVRAQVQTQLMLADRDIGWVIALQGSRLGIYEEPADKEMQERITEAVAEFWALHLSTGERPEEPPFQFTLQEKAK
jgi:predicted phage-related endonuclease